ncbi:hypothetical protein I4U23_012023 [Adineta vaga]|nr:hypothetical protein I4U23_012023 [Adineta vaga]
MSYAPTDEKVPIVPMSVSQPTLGRNYRDNREIRQTRTILVVVLAIKLTLAVLYLIHQIYYFVKYNQLPAEKHSTGVVGFFIGGITGSVIAIIYHILFLIFVSLYQRIPILILTWLSLIELIIIGIGLAFAIISIIFKTFLTTYFVNGLIASILLIIISGILSILIIITVVFGLKLSKLMKLHETYQLIQFLHSFIFICTGGNLIISFGVSSTGSGGATASYPAVVDGIDHNGIVTLENMAMPTFIAKYNQIKATARSCAKTYAVPFVDIVSVEATAEANIALVESAFLVHESEIGEVVAT